MLIIWSKLQIKSICLIVRLHLCARMSVDWCGLGPATGWIFMMDRRLRNLRLVTRRITYLVIWLTILCIRAKIFTGFKPTMGWTVWTGKPIQSLTIMNFRNSSLWIRIVMVICSLSRIVTAFIIIIKKKESSRKSISRESRFPIS